MEKRAAMVKRFALLFAVAVYLVCAAVFIYVCTTSSDQNFVTLTGYLVSSTITVVTLIAAVVYLKTSPSEAYREKYMQDEEEKE